MTWLILETIVTFGVSTDISYKIYDVSNETTKLIREIVKKLHRTQPNYKFREIGLFESEEEAIHEAQRLRLVARTLESWNAATESQASPVLGT